MIRKMIGVVALAVMTLLYHPGCAGKPSEVAGNARVYVSGTAQGFTEQTVKTVPGVTANVVVRDTEVFQTIEGFGGAFNEKGWAALSVLSEDTRGEVLRMLFDPERGLGLTVCRVPIGASDYAMSRYTLDETPGDYQMARFSIDRDKEMLIPYVKAAQKIQPALRLWASAWTPPTWMKDNSEFDGGHFMDDPRAYAAYALYLANFIKAYGAEGMPIEAVAVQNEPLILTDYPSCSWTGAQYLVFVRDYLGPLFEKEGIGNAIMLGTFTMAREWPQLTAVLKDPKARGYVGIIGLQWTGIDLIPSIGDLPAGVRIWQTETDCGNNYRGPSFDPDKPQNDFSYAVKTWRLMGDYLNAGASVYDMWNMVLDETGKNMDAVLPWPQNSAVVVDSRSGAVTYTPMFYAFGSFSRYVPPGSKRLGIQAGSSDAVAFADPDGRTIVVIPGKQRIATRASVKVRDTVYRVEIPAGCFGTLAIDAAE
jgi:glucosylceramidase